MRFMILVRATPLSEAGVMPTEEQMAEMGAYHEELARAGILLDGSGLHPSARGWRIRFAGGRRTVINGPFTEAKELVAGYTILEVKSREEALEWTRRFPDPAFGAAECEIEVRQLFDLDDFAPGPAVERFRGMELPSQR